MISVIIPAYNACSTLGAQLDALATQKEVSCDFEVLIVDNGSTDRTAEVVLTFRRRFARLRLLEFGAVRGAAAARNAGAAAAEGELLAFTDADDVVSPHWLAGAASLLKEERAFGTGPLVPFDREPSFPSGAVTGRPPCHMGFLAYAPGTNFWLSRSSFVQMGGFRVDRRTGEDVDLSWRLQLAGHVLTRLTSAVAVRQRARFQDVLRQYFSYGRTDPHLYRDFRPFGVPAPSARSTLRTYAGLIARIPFLPLPWTRSAWLHQVARRAGRIKGTIEARTLYL